MLTINCKGKRTVGKANKGINVEKIIIGLKIKVKTKKEKRTKKRKSPQNCKSPVQRQRFIISVKYVTEENKTLKSLIRFHSANKINNYN